MSAPGERIETVMVAEEQAGDRLDRVLAATLPALSRTRLKALIQNGAVAAGGRTILDPGFRVKSGDALTVAVPPVEPAEPAGEIIPLTVLYEDDALIVIDKPAGLVVHPAAGHQSGTLVNALIAHCGASLSGIGGVMRPGIVHRLDKDTSGVMVVAKTDRAHKALSAQFADHGRTGPLQRSYLAFAWGAPDRPRGTVDAPIDRHPHARDRMAVRGGGREALTHWEVKARYGSVGGKPLASLLECRLETGRTHQIRVHLAHIGHPILGDATYSAGYRTKETLLSPAARDALAGLGRQALHAYLLVLEHPATGEILQFRSELPDALARLRDALSGAPPLPARPEL
jgi:23S rRNA pseudouridine1911/1915/1917 synthase